MIPKPLTPIAGMSDPGAGDREIRVLPPVGRGAPHAPLFFQVIDGREIIDRPGRCFPVLSEARAEAIRTAGAILRDEGDEFWNGTEWHMNVTDAGGQPVLKLRFSADNQGIAPEEGQESGLRLSSFSAGGCDESSRRRASGATSPRAHAGPH